MSCRERLCSRSSSGRSRRRLQRLWRRNSHRLTLPVGERTPTKLQWTEAEESQPECTEDKVHRQHGGDGVVDLVVLDVAIPVPRAPNEDCLHREAGENVVGESHLADGGDACEEPAKDAETGEQKKHGGSAESPGDTCQVVGEIESEGAGEHVKVAPPCVQASPERNRPCDAKTDDRSEHISSSGALEGEEAETEEGHAEEHETNPVSEAEVGSFEFARKSVFGVGTLRQPSMLVLGDILVDLFGGHTPPVLEIFPTLKVGDLLLGEDLMVSERDVGLLCLLLCMHGGECLAELHDTG